MKEHHKPRRAFLKLSGAALTAVPLLASSRWAAAAKNDAMRAALKYQDKPDGDDGSAHHDVAPEPEKSE